MISIIVCSIDESRFLQLRSNIQDTIGTEFELIRITNYQNEIGLCQAYNEGVLKATNPFLCFIHEDISFITNNWGQALLNCFNSSQAGMIGIAGAKFYSLPPIGWFQLGQNILNITQPDLDKNLSEVHLKEGFTYETNWGQVSVIDGVFMAVKKELALKYRFDEERLKGFHGYDMDFCLSVGRYSSIVVTSEILIKHLSEGTKDAKWFNALCTVSSKWKNLLPVHTNDYNNHEIKELNIESLKIFFYVSSRFIPRFRRVKMYFKFAKQLRIIGPASRYLIARLLKLTPR